MQLELTALGVRCRLQLLDLLGQHLGRLHGLGCLCDLGLLLGERRAGLLVVGRAYLPGRFRLLLLVFGLRVALLPLLLFALRLRTILPTIHGDRFPYPVGKEKACSRFHVGNRLLVRHKWKRRWGLGLISLNGYLEELLLAKYDDLFPESGPYDGTLADIGEVVGGATPSKKRPEYYCQDGIGWVTPRDLSNANDKFLSRGADDITEEGYNSCSAKLMPKGSVLFSSRAPIGYVAIAANEVATNQGFKSVVPNKSIGTAFTYCFLVRNKQRIADMGAGTTFPEVSSKIMKSVKLTIPRPGECKAFSAFANPLLYQQYLLETEGNKLAALRDTLLPKLMSGEIDVSKVDLKQLNSHLGEKSIDDILRCTYQSHLPFNFSAYLTGRKFLVCRREDVLGCKQRFPTFLFMHIGTCLFQR